MIVFGLVICLFRSVFYLFQVNFLLEEKGLRNGSIGLSFVCVNYLKFLCFSLFINVGVIVKIKCDILCYSIWYIGRKFFQNGLLCYYQGQSFVLNRKDEWIEFNI